MRKTFLVMSRLIDLFVDILPIDELGFKHVKLQSEGRPPYNPATLLKLYLYGYKHSISIIRKSKCSRVSKRKVHFTKRSV